MTDKPKWEGFNVPHIPSGRIPGFEGRIANRDYIQLCRYLDCDHSSCKNCLLNGSPDSYSRAWVKNDRGEFWNRLDRFIESKYFLAHCQL